MNTILDFLVSTGEIDLDKRADIFEQLKNPVYENMGTTDDCETADMAVEGRKKANGAWEALTKE